MKRILRNYLINLVALVITTKYVPGLTYVGGFRVLLLGSAALMLINLAVIPLLKVIFLPLNLLTLGLFTWVINVIGLYFLTVLIPEFKLISFNFSGLDLGMLIIPPLSLNILQVAILSSFLIGLITHLLHWLCE